MGKKLIRLEQLNNLPRCMLKFVGFFKFLAKIYYIKRYEFENKGVQEYQHVRG